GLTTGGCTAHLSDAHPMEEAHRARHALTGADDLDLDEAQHSTGKRGGSRACSQLAEQSTPQMVSSLKCGIPPAMARAEGLPSRTPGVRWLPAPPPLVVTAPATAQNATALRRTFHRWAKALIDNDTINDLTLAVYEALTNAAEHAFTTHKEPGTIWLYATIANDEVLITITDNGTWKPPDKPPGHRGRGLPLIHQLTTHAHLQRDPQGTTVRLRHQLPPQCAD
ncbi:MAG: ATP-binding protein, partial [Pseudonocardiaceae bacterium]